MKESLPFTLIAMFPRMLSTIEVSGARPERSGYGFSSSRIRSSRVRLRISWRIVCSRGRAAALSRAAPSFRNDSGTLADSTRIRVDEV